MAKRAPKPESAFDRTRTLLERDVREAAGGMLEELAATLADAAREAHMRENEKASKRNAARLATASLRALQLLCGIEVTLPTAGSRAAEVAPMLTALARDALSSCRRDDRMRLAVDSPHVLQQLPEILQQHLTLAAEMLVAAPVLAPSPLLRDITNWLEQEDRLTESIADESTWHHVVEPIELASRAWESFDGPVDRPPSIDWVRQVLERALNGDTWYWGEEYPVHVQVNVPASNGITFVLACRFISFNMLPPVQWIGLFAHGDDYCDWFRNEGYFVTLSDFDRLPRSRKVALTRMGRPTPA